MIHTQLLLIVKIILCLSLGVSAIALDSPQTCSIRGESGDCLDTPEVEDDAPKSLSPETLQRVMAFHGGKEKQNEREYGTDDHLECDVETLGLTKEQLGLIYEAYNSPNVQDPEILEMAERTNFKITPHLAYRYFASAGWTEMFHGVFVNDSIVHTVKWRSEYGLTTLDPTNLRPLIEKGLCYADLSLDKAARPAVYVKTANISGTEEVQDYIKLIMYTVNKAVEYTNVKGNGEFIAIVDMGGFSWSKCPPVASLKELMNYLKRHFPYRLQAVYVVNASMAFSMLWKIFKPILPKRAVEKTHILTNKEAVKMLTEKVGLEHVEEDYGGSKPRAWAIADMDAYLSNGAESQ